MDTVSRLSLSVKRVLRSSRASQVKPLWYGRRWWEYKSGETRGLYSGKLESTIPKAQQPCQSQPCPCTAPALLPHSCWIRMGRAMGEGNVQELPLGGFQARPKHSQRGRDTGRGCFWCALPWQDERQSCRDTQTMWIPAGADLTQRLPGLCCFLVALFDVPWWLHPAPHTPVLPAHTPVSPVPGHPKDTGPDDLWCPVQYLAPGHPSVPRAERAPLSQSVLGTGGFRKMPQAVGISCRAQPGMGTGHHLSASHLDPPSIPLLGSFLRQPMGNLAHSPNAHCECPS